MLCNAVFDTLIMLQSTVEELELDCQHIKSIVCSDSEFEGLLNTKDVSMIDAVFEAFKVLHEAPTPTSDHFKWGTSPQACMVVAILIQWLIRYLCKRLMQIMTPEALTVHIKKIATSYIKNYLQFQHHFSLKKLITSQNDNLQMDNKRSGILAYTNMYINQKLYM